MWKLLTLLIITSLVLSLGQRTAQTALLETPEKMIVVKSPNRRFEVRFSDQRSDSPIAGKLWGKITVRDLKQGTERTARVAEGQRGKGIFEGFSQYETSQAWSPDGLYLAYWDNSCQDEGSVPGGVVCHLHEVHFLSMNASPACREELVLGRYAFGGWARGRPHSISEILINEAGQRVQRLPCADRKGDEVVPNAPVKGAVQAIDLFQHYWDSIVLAKLDQNQKRILADNMSERVRTKKLSARLASYRSMFARVSDTLSPAERESLILFGAPRDLDRAGECWIIESFTGCPCSEVAGCIDAKTGQLIFVWIMPEG